MRLKGQPPADAVRARLCVTPAWPERTCHHL